MHSNCLNCNQQLEGNYCKNCGQKSSTHRYSLQHFIQHDVIHGVWHVDKGVLFTLKQLFTRPGHSIREYIEGKRVNYFNYISLIILLLAISSFISHYTHIKISDFMPEASKARMNSFEAFSTKYPKLVLVIAIPIYAFFSFIWFRKAKLNFTEYVVLNSYKAAGDITIGLLFTTLTIFYTDIKVLTIIYYLITFFSTFGYNIWFHYQFFSKYEYSRKALFFRSAMVPLSYMILSVIFGIVVAIIDLTTKH